MGRRNPSRRQSGKVELPSSQLRIIAGQWRGRKLEFIAEEGLRPTPDRVRETLFNWIQSAVPGAHCLDMFSGSGALGLEALSRDAESATFVDLNTVTSRKLRDNLQLLKCQNGEVIQADVLQWLENRPTDQSAQYDLVFMDPPFRKDLVRPCCALLESHNLLTDNALIYVETESELGPPEVPSHWTQLREKTAGQVSYRLYSRES
ncbi:16S rRNA (guanine(966)-N(2))-methyltransferase RsmD [Neptuniibacter caesariensis]|uniref:Ribosomal RNA small subunit methyltransferase D n=1 Tax=Neptuniibacter caesariensis TaxID=207954 RepID=A0A7U8GTS7_NEPCE|nr:16S rRNA (guanine(966)-N(2))-methyltransferase RsmD [Neptuniibacter caesariensis]EAR62756.1 putative methyltransferase [Oceanospirillum sp. MED92] [Neptuniibacter caesariensis]